jgi:hydroxymethylbilane synthase
VVGTSSVRRCAQLARRYPHLKAQDVRGNINTRLSKLDAEDGPFTCLILAAAGLIRLDLHERITQYLDSKNGGMLHAVGQGALGVEIRMSDDEMMALLEKIADQKATIQCAAERSLLRMLEGGCSAPLGVETDWVKGRLQMRAALISVDGSRAVEVEKEGQCGNGKDAEFFGIAVAEEMVKKGATEILEEIERNKKVKDPIPVNEQ